SQSERAIILVPNSAAGYEAKADYLTNIARKYSEAISVVDEGLAVNPNLPYLYTDRSIANISLRQYEQGKSDILQAMRFSPRDPSLGIFHWLLGAAEFGLGHLEASAEECNEAIELGVRLIQPYVCVSAAYAAQDKIFEAKATLEEARQAIPSLTDIYFTIKFLHNHYFNTPGFFEALSKAGVPYQ